MKQVRLGDVPLEFFTGVGDLRSHDKTGNKLSVADVLQPVSKELPLSRRIVLADRQARKEKKKELKRGTPDIAQVMGRGVSVNDLNLNSYGRKVN